MEIFAYFVPAIVLGGSVYLAVRAYRRTGSAAKGFKVNLIAFALLFIAVAAFPFAVKAAETEDAVPLTSETGEAQEAPAAAAVDPSKGMGMLAAAIALGLGGIGGGIAVAAAAPAAIGATSEDPSAFGKYLIFVALGESIALYGLAIAIMILAKY